MDHFMRRCFDLARLGAGYVSPNPMVGAVLVHGDRIIGEGWHRQYGAAHAEVNAVRSVRPADRPLIAQATLYCSLEPCSHYGKTPPCVELILEQKIPRVIVCNTDPNPLVAGKGLQRLREAGVQVESGILEAEGLHLNRAFFTWIEKQRPYIVLKWAQSADGFIGLKGERTAVSGPAVQRLVHRWRHEADAILVGTTTATIDNPRLDNRLYAGTSPLRIALDFKHKIPGNAFLLDDSRNTWIIGPPRDAPFTQTRFLDIDPEQWIPGLLQQLRTDHRAILLVEGGAVVLQQFLDGGWWDEIRVIENSRRLPGAGIPAPGLPTTVGLSESFRVGNDWVQIFTANVPG